MGCTDPSFRSGGRRRSPSVQCRPRSVANYLVYADANVRLRIPMARDNNGSTYPISLMLF